jgi:hypothetical protein
MPNRRSRRARSAHREGAKRTAANQKGMASPRPNLRKAWGRVPKVLGFFFFGLIPFLAWLFGWGPLWPVEPEMRPYDANDEPSLRLGWKVQNKSDWFDMPNTRFRCGIDLLYAEDEHGKKVIVRDSAFLTAPVSISRGKSINVPCTPGDLLQLRRPSGSLSIYGSSTTMTGPTGYSGRFRVLKACVWVAGEYRLWGMIPWSLAATSVWQWPATPTQKMWIEGPAAKSIADQPAIPGLANTAVFGLRALTFADPQGAPELLPDALDCSLEARPLYVLVTGPGQMILVVPPSHQGLPYDALPSQFP